MQNLRNGKKKLSTTRLADTEDNLVADKGGAWGLGERGEGLKCGLVATDGHGDGADSARGTQRGRVQSWREDGDQGDRLVSFANV